MTALIVWSEAALLTSAVLMLAVLAVRHPVRRLLGPRLGYALWAIPAVRLFLPTLPADLFDLVPLAGRAATLPLIAGPSGVSGIWSSTQAVSLADTVLIIWLIGATGLFALCALRHFIFCRGLRANGVDLARIGTIRVIATAVEGPLAFGVFRRFIAVPHAFTDDYDANERRLALAHECAHHARGDLIANWASLAVLAVHWWNPIAWAALRAFREDQEFAVDAHVLAAAGPSAVPDYARVLAKAAGIGALPACNLNARSNLKGRLMMLTRCQPTSRRLTVGALALVALGGTALAATATTDGAIGKQAVTIGVKPDGAGGHVLVIANAVVAPGASLPGGMTLPADFGDAGGCSLKPAAKPFAMVIKGSGATRTYTVMCASAAPAPLRATLAEGVASLKTMRASVATQPASAAFPEAERSHALGAVDRSVREVEATLAAAD